MPRNTGKILRCTLNKWKIQKHIFTHPFYTQLSFSGTFLHLEHPRLSSASKRQVEDTENLFRDLFAFTFNLRFICLSGKIPPQRTGGTVFIWKCKKGKGTVPWEMWSVWFSLYVGCGPLSQVAQIFPAVCKDSALYFFCRQEDVALMSFSTQKEDIALSVGCWGALGCLNHGECKI